MKGHGTTASYRRGCRCDDCKRANAAHFAAAVKARRAKGLPPDDPRHGKAETYSNWSCRCDPCRDAWAVKMAGDRERRARPEVTPVVHGRSGYDAFGCRCHVCRSAQAVHQARYLRPEWPTPSYGNQWTGPEMELAARTDLTARQVAQMIGRTAAAVVTMRTRMRRNPRDSRLAGVAQPPG